MNSTNPAAMKAPVFCGESNSAALLAMREANVSPPLNSDAVHAVFWAKVDTMKVTAIVSPRARPSASMAALITPGRPKGRTAVRIISQRVAPNAKAPSLCVVGVWAKTSREIAVTIGRIMIAKTTPMKKIVPPVMPVRANSGNHPT